MPSANMEAAAALAGRLLLAALFLHEAWAKLTGDAGALAYMQAFGVPGQLLPFAIAAELAGGLLVSARLSDPLGGARARRVLHRHRGSVPHQARRSQSAPAFREGLGDRGRLPGAVRARRRRLGAGCAAIGAKVALDFAAPHPGYKQMLHADTAVVV